MDHVMREIRLGASRGVIDALLVHSVDIPPGCSLAVSVDVIRTEEADTYRAQGSMIIDPKNDAPDEKAN